MAYSPLAMGRLTGKYSAANPPQVRPPSPALLMRQPAPSLPQHCSPACALPASCGHNGPLPPLPPSSLGPAHSSAHPRSSRTQGARRFGSYGFDRIQPIVDKLAELGAAHGGKTPAQVALNWCICKGAVPIPGAKTAAQARAACMAGHLLGLPAGWRLAVGLRRPPGLHASSWHPACCADHRPSPSRPPCTAWRWQAEANCGALGWRLAADEVEALDELAIEGHLLFGQHG